MTRIINSSFLKTFFILCSLLLLPTYCSFKFNEDGEFTVLQFTDFHYCETELGDQKTLELQRKLLDIVKPDLVIVSGDAVSGFENRTAGFYENCWKKWTQPFVDTKTYYAYTLGNHDAESDFNRTQIVQLDKTNPYSVLKTAEGIPDTATYRIPIYSSINQSHISTNIWVLDSGSVGCGDDPYSWGCIEKSHVDWYDQESKKFKQQYGPNVHHVAFYHIAIPEYRNAYNEGEVYGGANEGIGCPTVNTGFFSKILENGDISAMFVGHDHKNDFGGWYQGVEFAYGKKSGYGSYGTSRGARIIRFEEMTDGNGQVVVARDHYVIQEDGQILTNKQVKNVGWSRQLFCLPAHGNIFVILKSIGVFHVLINFVLVPVAVLLLWKYVLKKFAKKCVEKIVPRVKYIWTSVMHLFSNYAHF